MSESFEKIKILGKMIKTIDIFYSSFHLDWNNFPLKGLFIQFIKEIFYSEYDHSLYNKLIGNMNEDGLTLVPTKMYFKKGKAKIEIAVAKGKKKIRQKKYKKN